MIFFPKIKNFGTRRVAIHALFWLTVFCLLVLLDWQGGEQTLRFSMFKQFVNIAFYAIIYYVNSEYLIPNYLRHNYFWQYLGFLLGFAVVITPFKVFLLYIISDNDPTYRDDQIYYFIISFLTAGASTIVKISSDWAKSVQIQRELETRTMQSELNFLKSQINPHFLFNTLNSLYALTLKKSDEAPEVVIKLSEMMRYMLYECNEPKVYLDKEIGYLSNYLDLEKLRHKKMDIKFSVEGDTHSLMIAPLIFIAFIENAFKHGASNSIAAGFVHIHIHVEQGELNLYVENSKPEKQPSQEPKISGGIGLVNVRRRLDILYPDLNHLDIYDNPNTYAVNLWIKL